VAVAVCVLLTCVILSGHTFLRPNKNLAGGIRLYDPHDMKLLVTVAVYISRRRGGDPVAALQTSAPVAAQIWSAFLPDPPDPPAFSNTPRGSSTPKAFGFYRRVWRR
jgi:hypothetical protein